MWLIRRQIDLYHFLSHQALGSWGGRGSSSWGWTSADGREIVAIGQYDGTAFAEITKEGKLVYLGRLPQYDKIGSNWREIRIVGDIAVIGSEAIKHGVQFFDMKKLLDLDPANPKNFTQDELTGHWDELPVGRTHNIVVNHELNYAIAVGSVGGNETIRVRGNLPCRGGLIFLDISDPTNVTSPGCASGKFNTSHALKQPSNSLKKPMGTFMMLNALFIAVRTSDITERISVTATMKIR